MDWDMAVAWADGLVFGGFNDWRLPLTPHPDCIGYTCTNSEMAHLLNVDGITAATPGLFSNVQPYHYWSGTESFHYWPDMGSPPPIRMVRLFRLRFPRPEP
jgi:hypothetical protein